jgi:hypothetical protein
MVLPGFRQFRYPSKLLTFTALGLSGLAGLGWDRMVAPTRPERGRGVVLGALLVALTLTALGVGTALHGPILAALTRAAPGSLFGPFQPRGALRELHLALVQASVVLGTGLALMRWGCRAPALAGALAIGLTAADLALANARYVLTLPQELFETTPEVVRVIEDAERTTPAPGLYRVHRMPLWDPIIWRLERSDDRVRDFVVWERNTIQPKYGLRYGVNYTVTRGVAELYDYDWFFGPFYRTIDEPTARMLGAKAGEQVVVYPRRGLDMWNTRYFVLPLYPGGWKEEHRGYAAFLPSTDSIYPRYDDFNGPGGKARRQAWVERQDFQILRNRNAYPRAWVVHSARFAVPIQGLERTDRDALMEEILYPNDAFWHDDRLRYFDPRVTAWIELELERRGELNRFLTGARPGGNEQVKVVTYTPRRVELEAALDQPGVVILADIYYRGWRLTIDGEDSPIYRANRMMRGAAVPAGRHRLVYTYAPRSFVVGGRITLAALAALAVLVVYFSLRPVTLSLLPLADPVVE